MVKLDCIIKKISKKVTYIKTPDKKGKEEKEDLPKTLRKLGAL